MSRPRIVIVIGDGHLQRLVTDTDQVDILLLDADFDDNGTELIGNMRYWVGLMDPEIDSERVARIFSEHYDQASKAHEQEGYSRP